MKLIRWLSYVLVVLYLIGYFVSGLFNNISIYKLLSFDVSTGAFWLVIVLIILCHLDFFRDIVKDVARSKVSEFTASEYYKESINQLLEDSKFRKGIADIVNDPSALKDTEFVEGELSTTGNIVKRKGVQDDRQRSI